VLLAVPRPLFCLAQKAGGQMSCPVSSAKRMCQEATWICEGIVLVTREPVQRPRGRATQRPGWMKLVSEREPLGLKLGRSRRSRPQCDPHIS
jgi:hypothetical protein